MEPAFAWRPPDEFEEYRLVRPLGRGAMGEVFLGQDTLLDRAVAVKFITGEASPDARERFFLEARAIARLSHPNVVQVFRVGEVRRRPYLVSELIRGRTLAEIARPLGAAELMRIAIGLARGLAAAHRRGVLHRDLKPANAMLAEDGEVKLLDFGLAELLDPIRSPRNPATREGAQQPADFVGTPLYAAPEIWRCEPPIPQSDVYSLGAILYELAAGRAPHQGLSVSELRSAVQRGAPSVQSSAPGIDVRLAALIDRCLAVDPNSRFESGDAVREALERLSTEMTRPGAISLPGGNPYRGLAAFEAEHRALFFGRAGAVRQVVDRLRSEAFVLVAGDSGVGKSSLCRAGVLPLVAESGLDGRQGWTVAHLVPGKNPVAALAGALAPCVGMDEMELADGLAKEPAAIARIVKRKVGPSILILVDQLEELFTLSEASQAAATAEAIAALGAREIGVRVLATIRGDFLARVASLPGLDSLVARGLFFLQPLTRAELREAIVDPAALFGFRFESEAMVEALVNSAEHAAGGLPLLQFALAELWEARDESRQIIPLAALERLGGVEGALARYADNVIAHQSGHRETAKQILIHLVTPEGTRARLSTREIVARVGPLGQPVLESLVRARLLVAREGEGDEEGTFEIAHEALLATWDTLRGWLSGDAERRAIRQRLERAAAEWERLGHAKEALWAGRQLAEAKGIASKDLGSREMGFLTASRRSQRRRRYGQYALLCGIPLALAGVYGSSQMKQRSELQAKVASRLQDANMAIAEGDRGNTELEKLRQEAFAAFDAGKTEEGEQVWSKVRSLSQEVDRSYVQASQVLEGVLMLDASRSDVRTRFTDVLYRRALGAEQRHLQAQRDELLSRLSTYDEKGIYRQRWNAPGHLSVDTVPPGATISLSRIEADGPHRGVAQPQPQGAAPIRALELTPGSYLLFFSLPDRPVVRLPIMIGREESLAVNVTLPRRVPEGFVYIPAGRFLYGTGYGAGDEDEARRRMNSQPLHSVSTSAYLIGRTEVTFGEWISFLEDLPRSQRDYHRPITTPRTGFGALDLRQHPGQTWHLSLQPTSHIYRARLGEPVTYMERDHRVVQDWLKFPVSGINWPAAETYAQWLDKTGRVAGARLCTEHEWERAARGADDRLFPHGDQLDPDDANHDVTYGRKSKAFGPDEVGSHPASDSPFGVSDLAGNVWEFVASVGDSAGKVVIRGGGWYHYALTSRSTNREPVEPSSRFIDVGFRICANASAE